MLKLRSSIAAKSKLKHIRGHHNLTMADAANNTQAAAEAYDWRNSEAQAIIKFDLENGVLQEDFPSARVAWDQQYSKMVEFTGVTFKQFSTNLGNARRAFKALRLRATEEEQMQLNLRRSLVSRPSQ